MDQQVSRPGKVERPQGNTERPQQQSERVADGVRLTDVKPLPDIPALWRIGAVGATQIMGVLALIAALYFGRSILLPVAAGGILGGTPRPAGERAGRLWVPPALPAPVLLAPTGLIPSPAPPVLWGPFTP